MQDFHLRGRHFACTAHLSCPCGHTSLCILTSFFWKPDCFKVERNRYVPFAMKILEGTIAAPLNSHRALAVKVSWCSLSRIPLAWLFQLRLGSGFMLKVDCGTQCEWSVKKAVLTLPSHLYAYVWCAGFLSCLAENVLPVLCKLKCSLDDTTWSYGYIKGTLL